MTSFHSFHVYGKQPEVRSLDVDNLRGLGGCLHIDYGIGEPEITLHISIDDQIQLGLRIVDAATKARTQVESAEELFAGRESACADALCNVDSEARAEFESRR